MTQDAPTPIDPAENVYTAADIQILGGREAVRKRPGMYIGSTDQHGRHHLVYEIVYNSVDEAMAGCCDQIKITINQDSSVTVEDNGRGIPVDVHPVTKVSALETVMTTLHAGAKFGGKIYQVSGGLHESGLRWSMPSPPGCAVLSDATASATNRIINRASLRAN